MRFKALIFAVCCLAGSTVAAPDFDGRWRLTITGHNTYLYGEPQLGGGLQIPWEIVINFQIRGGNYELGNGRARLSGEAVRLSHPPGWVDCKKVSGTYLDRSLTMHNTPRIRFPVFPVAGAVDSEGHIELRPAYQPPGNYLAVTYECETEGVRASEWFGRAERGKQVMGKRQDAEKRVEGERRHVRVREVVGLPPDGGLTLSLVDGWQFTRGSADDAQWISYRLDRVKTQ